MSYIKPCQRALLDPAIATLAKNIAYIARKIEQDEGNQRLATTPGLAGYSIAALLLTLIEGQESDATYSAVIGVLEETKMELHRTHIAPFQEQKKFDNGEIVAVAQIN
jgi:hypothetical protein